MITNQPAIIARYQNGETGTVIAATLGCDPKTVYAVLERHGIKRRTRGTRSNSGVPLESILLDVARRSGVSMVEIMSNRRIAHVAQARQLFMWMAHREHGYSLPVIGSFLDRDHTTVLHGVRAIDSAFVSNGRAA